MVGLDGYLKKYFADNADSLYFRDERDKDKVINELRDRFSISGDLIVNTKTGQAVEPSVFEGVVYSVATPYLGVRGKGKYVPLFVDGRSTETKAAHKDAVEKLVDNFLDRKGYAFRYEHLGDFTIRQSIKNAIASKFLYEGKGDDGEVVFRKFEQGMFSQEFSANEVIDGYAKPFLDKKRTDEKQAALKSQGTLEEQPVVYSKKILPKHDPASYQREFERRALFKHGLPSKDAATLQVRRMVEDYAKQGIEKLNSYNPRVDLGELSKYSTPRESWSIEVENKSGYWMPNEML